MKRIIGLDVGSKTVGVAISDPFGLFAQGLFTHRRGDLESDLDKLSKIFAEKEAGLIVCGLPLNMDGTSGKSAQRVMNFANRLADRSGIPIVYQDERLSTVSAERVLIETKVRRENRKDHVDKIAASYILQSYLDGRANG